MLIKKLLLLIHMVKKNIKYSKSVFVGKSMIKKFKDDGGQSPIDAAYMNCKIYHWSVCIKFYRIMQSLKKIIFLKKSII